jgi:putative DNA primase/helicase
MASSKKATIERIRANFPTELQALDQWVCWRKVKRDDKWTKVPYDAKTGRLAKATDVATWRSFDIAARAYLNGQYDGVGFVFSEHDPFCGADFDHCIDAAGAVDPDKLATIRQLDSYTERSQSGTGAHVITRAKLPGPGRNNQKQGREIYDQGRFFVVTGDVMAGFPTKIEDRQEVVAAYYAEYFPQDKPAQQAAPAARQETSLDDQELLQRMFAASNGAKVQRLWDGRSTDYNGDDSAGDQALCNALAFWTGRDAARMDNLFRQSKRLRDKWDRNARSGETYGQGTIRRAIDSAKEVYTPKHRGTSGNGTSNGHTNGNGNGQQTVKVLDPATDKVVKVLDATTGEEVDHQASDGPSTDEDPSTDDGGKGKGGKDEKLFSPYHATVALSQCGYCGWRWNLVTEEIEVALANSRTDPDPKDTTWTVLNDGIEATIKTDMRSLGYKNMDAIRDLWLSRAYANRFHPIKDYLNGLEWDGKNHMGAMALYIRCTDPAVMVDGVGKVGWFDLVLKHWLVGAVAKVLHEGVLRAQNPMMVLAGPQNIGKSTLTHWLVSGVGDGFFTSEAINPENPEHHRYLAEKWIWESGELGTTTRRQDVEALKNFLTKEEVVYRVPYAKHSVHKPALSSFIGTINPELAGGFLVDITGNRRFVVCTVVQILHDYITKVDVNQLWAQAVHMYKSGFEWRLPVSMQAARDAVNDSYMVPDALEGYVLAYFDVDPVNHSTGADAWFTPTYKIVDRLMTMGVKDNTTALQMKLSKTLSALQVTKGRDTDTRQSGYYGLREKFQAQE